MSDQTAENSVTSSTSARAPQPQPPPPPLAVPANNMMVDHVVDVPLGTSQVPTSAGNPRQFVRRVARLQDSAPVMHNYNGILFINYYGLFDCNQIHLIYVCIFTNF